MSKYNRKNEIVVAATENAQDEVKDNLSTEQQAILENAPTTETVAENVVEPEVVAETSELVAEAIEPETVTTGNEVLENLKARWNDENDNSLDVPTLEEMVRNREITAEAFKEITDLDYEEKEPEPALPAIGHNMPPAEIDPVAEDIKENLSHFKPVQAMNAEEAREQAKEAIEEVIEHNNRSETSLRSRLAITFAHFVFWNTEGLASDGNKLFHVHRGMYKEVLAKVSELIEKDDMTPTLSATIGSAVETSILLMTGKVKIGYFVLSKDRKAVRQNDVAFSEYPSREDIPEGASVMQSVCIPSNSFAPRLPVKGPGGELQWIENTSESLVLAPSYVCKALYDALWDREGEFVFDPMREGRITGFTSGKDVAAKRKAEAAKAEKAKADTTARDKATQQQNLSPVQRETGGVPIEASETSVSVTTLNQLVNGKETLGKDEMTTLRKGLADLIAENFNLKRERAMLLAAQDGDLLKSIPALRSEIRARGPNLPDNAIIGLFDDVWEMATRCLRFKAGKELPVEMVKSAVRAIRALTGILEDTDDDIVIQYDESGNAVKKYENISIAA